MVRAAEIPATALEKNLGAHNSSGQFSSESVLGILKLIFARTPLPEVLAVISRLVDSQGE